MSRKVLIMYPNLQFMQVTPPGIMSLSAYLKKHGHTTSIFDTTFYRITETSADEERIENCQVRPFKFSDSGLEYTPTDMKEDFYKKIESFQPDIIAISVTDFTHAIAENLIKDIKQKYPNLFIVYGGVFSTFFPDYSIALKDLDAVCIGEGWGALLDLCNMLGTSAVYSIKNLWVKDGTKIYKNDIRAPLALSELPPDDFLLFDKKRYFRPMQGKMVKMVPVWIDLGCPYQCTYCVAPALYDLYAEKNYKYFRLKEVDQIDREIQYAIDTINPEYMYFSTETFFARPKSHVEAVAELYKRKYGLPFWCETRIETITEERVKLLKSMNCDRISIGLETGNEGYRNKVLKKTFSNETFFERMQILNDFGINVTINNIIGLPDETREMIFDTIWMNREIQKRFTNIDITMAISTYVPCGGESLRYHCLNKGYFKEEEYLNMPIGAGFHRGVFLNMPQITPIEIKGLLKTFPMYVKMPEKYFDKIKKAELLDANGRAIHAELREVYWDKYFKKIDIKGLPEDPVASCG